MDSTAFFTKETEGQVLCDVDINQSAGSMVM